jgi:hypothetical protein
VELAAFIWLRMRAVVNAIMNFLVAFNAVNILLTEELLASQEGFCSI